MLLLPFILGCAQGKVDGGADSEASTRETADTARDDTDSTVDSPSTDTSTPEPSGGVGEEAIAIVVGSITAAVGFPTLSHSAAGDGDWLLTGTSVIATPGSGIHSLGAERVAWFEGDHIVAVGDLSGDGVDDIVIRNSEWVGSDASDVDCRRVFSLYSGPVSGFVSEAAGVLRLEAPWVGGYDAGEATIEPFVMGTALVVSAPSDTYGITDHAIETRSFALGSVEWEDGDLIVSGDEAWHEASVADLGGDGARQLPVRTSESVLLFAEGDFEAPAAILQMGEYVYSVGAGGDLDGDGYADLVVGVADAALVFAGPVSSGDAPVVRVDSDTPVDYGYVDFLGGADLDQDGHDDLAAGDHSSSEGGRLYALFGPLEGTTSLAEAEWSVHGDAASDLLGYKLGVADDGVLFAGALGSTLGGDAAGGAMYVLALR